MKSRRHIHLAICGLAVSSCGDSAGGSGDSTSDTGATSGSADDDGPGSDPTTPTDPDATGTADSTTGPTAECARTVRYPLFDGQICGRVLVGRVDFDNNDDIIAFGQVDSILGPLPTTLQTFLGDSEGLNNGEVHCCLETSRSGAGAIFDINEDGEGDPLWAGERRIISGDVGTTELTLEKSIRAPEGGYTGDGVLFANADTPAPAFMVGKITPDVTGVIAVADGMLLSLVGNGDELDLQPTNSLALDPVPNITALATIEFDGQAGIEVVGVGSDGLWVWAGSVEGVFSPGTLVELPGNYTDVESIDVDLDGARELVLFGADEPIALVDRTNEIVVTTTDMPIVPPPATVLEVDGDMYPDVVGVEGDNLVMYPGDGDVFGSAVVLAPIGATNDIAFGDFDGDGMADVVACDDQGVLVIYQGTE